MEKLRHDDLLPTPNATDVRIERLDDGIIRVGVHMADGSTVAFLFRSDARIDVSGGLTEGEP